MSNKDLQEAVQKVINDEDVGEFLDDPIEKAPVVKKPNRAVFFAMALVILAMLCLCIGSNNQTLQALYLGVALVVFVAWIVKGGRLFV